jgi:parvulin-like peptidyl-prolyl isomerase
MSHLAADAAKPRNASPPGLPGSLRSLPTLALLLLTSTTAGVLASPLQAADGSSGAGRSVVDRIVLRVNDRIATLRDYERRLDDRIGAIMAAELSTTQRQEFLARASEDALHEIFEELLVLSRADQLGIQVTESDLDRAVEDAKRRAGIESDQQFAEALAQSGLTLTALRDRLRRTEISQEVIGREVQPRIRVTEEVLQKTYRENQELFQVPAEVKLREVVVLDEATPDVAARTMLTEEIAARIGRGATLDEIAENYAAGGAVSGVMDLGFVRVDELDPELAKAAEALAVGAVSGPVAARGGTHFLQLMGRREAKVRPFDEVVGELRARERARQFEQELETYMQELEDRAYIVADPPAEAAGFRGRQRNVRTDELARAMAAVEGQGEATAPPAEGDAAAEAPPPAGEPAAPPAQSGDPAPPPGG